MTRVGLVPKMAATAAILAMLTCTAAFADGPAPTTGAITMPRPATPPAGTAFADVPEPTTGPADLGPLTSFPPPLSGEVPGGYLFDLTGLGKDFGRAMADRGIYFNGRLSTEGVGQVSG